MANRSKVDEFLNALSQFEQLRTLTLYAVSSLAPQGLSNGLSDDPDFDGARATMTKLHAQKVGIQFYWIEIHLHHHAVFDVIGGRQTKFRSFASKISVSGVYQQLASSRKVAPKVLVGSTSNWNLQAILPHIQAEDQPPLAREFRVIGEERAFHVVARERTLPWRPALQDVSSGLLIISESWIRLYITEFFIIKKRTSGEDIFRAHFTSPFFVAYFSLIDSSQALGESVLYTCAAWFTVIDVLWVLNA
jgi:hypothetical protein